MTDFKYELQVKEAGDWKSRARANTKELLYNIAINLIGFKLKDEGTLFKIVEVED